MPKHDAPTDEEILQAINDFPQCPKCGAEIIERDGLHGAFYTCSRWPKCRQVRSRRAHRCYYYGLLFGGDMATKYFDDQFEDDDDQREDDDWSWWDDGSDADFGFFGDN